MSREISDRETAFAAARPRLFALAYRMLGVRAEAEEIVQDAWLRLASADEPVRSVEAFLVTTVTRLAIDRLRALKRERETYPGWWLPEPLVEPADEVSPESAIERADDVSMALLWVLERLAPEERAAFLLREVFGYDYAALAALLGKSEAACRQSVHRASERVRESRPRFPVDPERHRALVARFVEAAARGDRASLESLLDAEVQLVSDGGGKVRSFARILHGAERITNLYWAVARRLGARAEYRLARINGEIGVLRYLDGALESAQTIVTDGERVVAIYAVRNPDKLPAELSLP